MAEAAHEGPTEGSSSLREALAAAGERVVEIVDSAERVADEIRAEAEAEAAEYLRARRAEADRLYEARADELAEIVNGLPDRSERLWRDLAALTAELQRASHRIRAAAAAPEAQTAAASEPAGTQPSERIPEEAVLRAAQLAVVGTDRAEIQRALSSEFGLSDPAAVTDQLLDGIEASSAR